MLKNMNKIRILVPHLELDLCRGRNSRPPPPDPLLLDPALDLADPALWRLLDLDTVLEAGLRPSDRLQYKE